MTTAAPPQSPDRLGLLERRVAELEAGLRPTATWRGWSRAVLRWLATTPPLLLAVLVGVDSVSATTSLPPGLLLAALWATAAVLWAIAEVFSGGSLRFRVSRLLLIVGVLAAALGYWRAAVFGPFHAERACLSGVKGLKGRAHTDPFGPTWLMGLFGSAHFQRVVQLELAGPEVDPAQVGKLRDLPHLRCVFLTGPKVDDRAINGLIALPAIEEVFLTDSLVTKAGIDRFRRARPGVEINRQGKVVDDPNQMSFQ